MQKKGSLPVHLELKDEIGDMNTIGTKSNNQEELIAEDYNQVKAPVEFHSMTSLSFHEKQIEKSPKYGKENQVAKLATYGNTEGSDQG